VESNTDLVSELVPKLVEAALLLLGAFLAWSRGGISTLIQNKVGAGTKQNALLWVNEVVFAVVAEAQQTIVSELKKDYADGKITKEELTKSLAEVKRRVLAKTRDLTFGRLLDAFGLDFKGADTYLNAKVESAVFALKDSAPQPQQDLTLPLAQ
jgi:hypothetical protein